jgi:hypothetical protein
MAQTLKVLAQTALTTITLTDLYTVPSATTTAVSSVVVCNRGNTPTTFRLSVAVAGAADATKQYLYYDVSVNGNDSFVATIGLTLGATDVIRGYAGNSNVTMQVFGAENT